MERIKIHYHEPEYFINRENKTVTCKMNYDLSLPIDLLIISDTILSKDNRSHIVAKATTTCHGEDVFDIQKGMKVALAKAEINAERQVSKFMRRIQKRMDDITSIINDRIAECAINCEHNYEYLERNF